MFTRIFLGCFSLSVLTTQVSAGGFYKVTQSVAQPQDSSSAMKEECIRILKKMDPSLTGRTAQGNNYNLYAFRRGKEWTFLILDSAGYYSVRQDKKGKGDIIENPSTYTDMLCFMSSAQLIRKKNKPKNVSGMTLSSYYKFKPSAKKMYRSFVKLQSKVKFLNKNIGSKGGLLKIFKKSMQ